MRSVKCNVWMAGIDVSNGRRGGYKPKALNELAGGSSWFSGREPTLPGVTGPREACNPTHLHQYSRLLVCFDGFSHCGVTDKY